METRQSDRRPGSTLIGVLAFAVLVLAVGVLWSVVTGDPFRQVCADGLWVLPLGIALIVGQALAPRLHRRA